jgi:hypothetical protein
MDDWVYNPEEEEQEFVEACKAWHLELLRKKEQIVPSCLGYAHPEPGNGIGKEQRGGASR